jgi:hypothetical protein
MNKHIKCAWKAHVCIVEGMNCDSVKLSFDLKITGMSSPLVPSTQVRVDPPGGGGRVLVSVHLPFSSQHRGTQTYQTAELLSPCPVCVYPWVGGCHYPDLGRGLGLACENQASASPSLTLSPPFPRENSVVVLDPL